MASGRFAVTGGTLACLCITFMTLQALSVSPVAAGPPTDAIRSTSNEVIRILQDEDMRKPERVQERRLLLEAVIGERLSYEEMSKRVLGPQWEKLSDREKQEFVSLFSTLLAKTYADKIEQYAGERMQYLAERHDGNFAEVRVKLISTKAEFLLDFRMVNRAGDWRVFDIVTDGVSLVNNYRQQFNRLLRTASYSDLIERLREKSRRPLAAAAE